MSRFSTFLFFSLIPVFVWAQTGTEVYLFDFSVTKKGVSVSNPVNISNNPGYDNQPSFTMDGKAVLFAYTVSGQTEVAKYDLETKRLSVLTETTGSEYSPIQTPDPSYFSAILLEKDGTQLLNRYMISEGSPDVLIPDVVIGYHAWENSNSLFAFVLGSPNTLQHIQLQNGLNLKQIAVNPGRSLHFHLATGQLYFLDKSDDQPMIKIYSSIDKNFITITAPLENSEDFALIDSKTLIMGKGSQLFVFDGNKKQAKWELVGDLASFGLGDISRLAVSPDQNYLAVVVAE